MRNFNEIVEKDYHVALAWKPSTFQTRLLESNIRKEFEPRLRAWTVHIPTLHWHHTCNPPLLHAWIFKREETLSHEVPYPWISTNLDFLVCLRSVRCSSQSRLSVAMSKFSLYHNSWPCLLWYCRLGQNAKTNKVTISCSIPSERDRKI